MISMEIKGDDPLLKGLNKFKDRAARAGLLDEIGSYGEESTRQRFIDQEDPEGKSWLPSERALAENGQTLIKDGHLMGGLTHDFNEAMVEWGSNRIYAGIQQFGGVIVPKNAAALHFKTVHGWVTAKKVTIPARAYLGINDRDRTEIGNIIENWTMGGFQ